jgi:aspartate carbamoyltransferase regulatory subunit
MSEQGPRKEDIKPRLVPIDNGTVLDHLPVGSAPKIVQLLGIDMASGAVTMAMNTESTKKGRKDLLFLENLELLPLDLEKIGLIAHGSTWNTIRDKTVVKKETIALPETAHGVIHCPNPSCITNAERIPTRFLIKENPLQGTCYYCERSITAQEMFKAIQKTTNPFG